MRRASKICGWQDVYLEISSFSNLNLKNSCVIISVIVISIFCICPSGCAESDIQCYSGQQYTFIAPCGDFLYLWNASAGSNAGVDQCRFLWTAPSLDSPEEVTISVLVSNKDLLSCSSMAEINVTVNPRTGCFIEAPDVVCQNSTGNAAIALDTEYAESYMWRIAGGSITSGNGSNKIIWTAGPAGIARISLAVAYSNGSTASCEREVKMIKCEPLSITCPPAKTVCADPGSDYATILPSDLGIASSSDPEAKISSNAPSSNQYPLGETAVTWVAEDDSGERASCVQLVRVVNCSEPALQLKVTVHTSCAIQAGEDISYTIELCNQGLVPLKNVMLWDDLPGGMEIVWAYPEPEAGGTWLIGTLLPGECREVQLGLRIRDTDLVYNMSQRVKGEGFVNVHANYNTATGQDWLKSCFYARADGLPTTSSCSPVRAARPGASLLRRESGSGSYECEEIPIMRTLNNSIKSFSSLSAFYEPTSFSLPSGRSVGYASLWKESSRSRNELTGESISEMYSSASKINMERSIEQDENSTAFKSRVEFEGVGRISISKADSIAHALPIYQSEEDYAGSFQSLESVDAYVSGVLSNRSTRGYGFAAVDKRIGASQRTYEWGTGSYASDELIESQTNHIRKNISLVHSPISFTYSPALLANQSIKWSEGIWSESGSFKGGSTLFSAHPSLSRARGNGSSISERYSYLDRLEKESTALGLKDMKTEASFSGQADLRVRYVNENGTDELDSIESYTGSYKIQRHSVLTDLASYDTPHLGVRLEGRVEDKIRNGVPMTIGRYNITLNNDGSRSLAPLQLNDVFPPGAEYITSTVRPSALQPGQAGWTLQSLGSGSSITIGLELNLTGAPAGDVVNRVKACGEYDGNIICSSDHMILERGALSCCPPRILVSKKGIVDAVDPARVSYIINLTNSGPDTVTVNITDQLPAGMSLLHAYLYPDRIEADKLIWIVPELRSGESKRIEYIALASGDGSYSSVVHIDAFAINGTGYDSSDALAYVMVNRTGFPSRSFRYGEWVPPAWSLNDSEESFESLVDGLNQEDEG